MTCRKCNKNPVHRINKCKECLREYARLSARRYYAENFKAEPHEYQKLNKRSIDYRLKIEHLIRSKTSIRKSLSAKFGAQPEKKYRAADILKGAKNELA